MAEAEELDVWELLRRDKAFIMRDVSFSDFKRGLEEKFGLGAEIIFYEVGKTCGKRSYQRLAKHYSGREALIQAMAKHKANERWGRIEVEVDWLRGSGSIRIYSCFESRAYGPSEKPVCHFIRGFLEAFLSEAYGKPLHLTEVACIAEGNPYCHFRVEEAKKTA